MATVGAIETSGPGNRTSTSTAAVRDGDVITVVELSMRALHTPGHIQAPALKWVAGAIGAGLTAPALADEARR